MARSTSVTKVRSGLRDGWRSLPKADRARASASSAHSKAAASQSSRAAAGARASEALQSGPKGTWSRVAIPGPLIASRFAQGPVEGGPLGGGDDPLQALAGQLTGSGVFGPEGPPQDG